jgi:hypothetical protein
LAEKTASLRLTADDALALERLKRATGVVSTTQAVRLSLRLALHAARTGHKVTPSGRVARKKSS